MAGIGLLAQAVLQWRRAALVHVAWWGRLPLALPLLWAGVCGFVVVLAVTSYPQPMNLPPCPAGRTCNSSMPACTGFPPLWGEAQLVLVVAAVLLILGWLALAALARRIHTT